MYKNTEIQVDLCVVGAGSVGLFAVYEAGVLNLQCHVIDISPVAGIRIDKDEKWLRKMLLEKIKDFNPGFSLGETIIGINYGGNGYNVV